MKNVISYSLYGNDSFYLKGAVANSLLAKEIFPGWVTRYYVDDTVPEEVISELSTAGSEIVHKPRSVGFSGSLWRFEVAYDPEVQYYIIRDTDDRLCLRQLAAVNEWIRSGKKFHIMRDHPNHKHEMMAGMWGGVSGAIEDFECLYKTYISKSTSDFWSDTNFLKNFIWEKYVKQDHTAHDEYWRPLGIELRFPVPLEHPGRFVGNKYNSYGDPLYDLIRDDIDNSSVFVYCRDSNPTILDKEIVAHIANFEFKNIYVAADTLEIDAALVLYKNIQKVHLIKVASRMHLLDIASMYKKTKVIYIKNFLG